MTSVLTLVAEGKTPTKRGQPALVVGEAHEYTVRSFAVHRRGCTMKQKSSRRSFIRRTGQLVVGGVLGVAVSRANATAGFDMSSSTQGKCATCKFWGGIRRVSQDGQTVTAESLGWCNNPESKMYQKTTTPETGPMKSWRKWDALT